MNKQQIKQALKQGGGTFINGVLTDIDNGYSVGVGTINIIDTNILKGDENITEMIMSLTENEPVFGLWVHKNNIYIDRVEIIKELDRALKVAKQNKEKAIYDNVIQKDIKVKY